MLRRPVLTCLASIGVSAGMLLAVPVGLASAATPAARAAVQAASPAATSGRYVAATAASTPIDFTVGLQLKDAAGARALAQAVSDPSSASYRQYLTAAQWEQRFSPTPASVAAVTSWLRSQGITVTAVTPDRMTIEASGTAAQISAAFGTSLNEYRVAGRVVRLAAGSLSVPSDLAPLVSGVAGVDEDLATPDTTTGGDAVAPPPGFKNPPQDCGQYYGQTSASGEPAYGGGYEHPLPWTPCGYTPAQLQSAYNLSGAIASGDDGNGVTVAIVDAYASSTLLSDAQKYAAQNQPSEPLKTSQFTEALATPFTDQGLCGASGWSGEQSLDVEAVHAMAPGAHILYVGAKNCITGLFSAVQAVVDAHAADIITDSWGDTAGDLLDPPGVRAAFDNVLLMADGTGIGVQFSSGDDGDNFAITGFTASDYPASSPYATAVGGTTLEIGPNGSRIGEFGWSTSKSILCTAPEEGAFPGCSASTVGDYEPPAPGAFDYGGGGGTSYYYPEPYYQEGVVPAALADRNAALTGEANRVEPDIAMDADPSTGMLIGETQTFPNGTYYSQYRIGGTSLASPLLAGVLADADQAAGVSLGFINPALYTIYRNSTPSASSKGTGALYDIVYGGKQAMERLDYVNEVNAQSGYETSVRTITYEGAETYCDGTGDCATQNVALTTGSGFDSMTGVGSAGPGFIAALSKL